MHKLLLVAGLSCGSSLRAVPMSKALRSLAIPKSALETEGRGLLKPSDVFDPECLRTDLKVAALSVPVRRVGEYLKRLRPHLLNVARSRNVADCDAAAAGAAAGVEQRKLVLLSRELSATDDAYAALPEDLREWVRSSIASGEASAASHVVTLSYEYFTAEQALRRLLPHDVEVPTSFEQAGHVVHLNLRTEQLPWKRVIARVVLDKNKTARTVVNKIGDISSEFRTYPLEVLAGDDETRVSLSEGGCTLEFDIRDVYWNSRLQSEHARLAETIPTGAVVADATCGVGPFAVPLAARRRINVHANDLNPAAVASLRHNAELNSCGAFLTPHGPSCARVFLRELPDYSHVLLNLPAAGLELLDAFRGLAARDPPPLVHCYCFAGASRGSNAPNGAAVVEDIISRASNALGAALPPAANDAKPFPSPEAAAAAAAAAHGATAVRWIRNVSPNKDMYCLSFLVPRECADAPQIQALVQVAPAQADDDPETKRPRLD